MYAWAAFALVGFGLAAAFVRLRSFRAPDFRPAWEAFATSGRGELHQNQGGLTVELDVGSARVQAAVEPDEHTLLPCTVVRAQFVLRAGPGFEVAPHELAREFRESLGWQAFSLGDAALDARFVRIGGDPAALERAFDEPARALLARLPAVRVYSSRTHVELHHPHVLDQPGVLAAAAELVGRLAQLDADAALATLRDLPGASFHAPDGSFAERTPAWADLEDDVRIAYHRHERRRVTWVTSLLPDARARGWFVIDDAGRPDAVQGTASLPAEALTHLPVVGASVLKLEEGCVRVAMDGTVTDVPRLLAAAEVCRALASSVRDGVYR